MELDQGLTFALQLRFEIIGKTFTIGASFLNNSHISPIEKLNNTGHLQRERESREEEEELDQVTYSFSLIGVRWNNTRKKLKAWLFA